MNFSTGDILRGSRRGREEAYHPIIFIGERNEHFFNGVMMTHDPQDSCEPIDQEG